MNAAIRIMKEGNMDAVKLEGGSRARVRAVEAVVEAGIAVMGHVGLTPQAISSLGGFRPQARTAEAAMEVLEHALALEAAGVFGVVLECVPAPVARAVTAALKVPTIGIGAGPHCSGQVLVYHDLLGVMEHPHYKAVSEATHPRRDELLFQRVRRSEHEKKIREGGFQCGCDHIIHSSRV